MRTTRACIGLMLAIAVAGPLTACADDEPATTTTTAAPTTTTLPADTTLAVWPASSSGFATPEAAARDFVTRVLGVNPRLGPFMPGDSNSGEMDVYIGEDLPSVPDVAKGTLILRRIDQQQWFVIAAANQFNTIDSPLDRARVPVGSLTVSGRARGFEGQVMVEAYLPGDRNAGEPPTVIDSASVMAGSAETPEPYSVTLDLSGVEPGTVVALLVRGGRGLEQDPGEFSAVPILVGPDS